MYIYYMDSVKQHILEKVWKILSDTWLFLYGEFMVSLTFLFYIIQYYFII